MTGNHLSPSCQSPLRPLCGHSPQTPSEPSGTGVDAALPLDELIQRFGIRLVGRRIPQDSAPLAPGPLICLGGISGAPNSRGERAAHSPSRSPGHEADCEGVDGDHRECTECVDRREAEKPGTAGAPSIMSPTSVFVCRPPMRLPARPASSRSPGRRCTRYRCSEGDGQLGVRPHTCGQAASHSARRASRGALPPAFPDETASDDGYS